MGCGTAYPTPPHLSRSQRSLLGSTLPYTGSAHIPRAPCAAKPQVALPAVGLNNQLFSIHCMRTGTGRDVCSQCLAHSRP